VQIHTGVLIGGAAVALLAITFLIWLYHYQQKISRHALLFTLVMGLCTLFESGPPLAILLSSDIFFRLTYVFIAIVGIVFALFYDSISRSGETLREWVEPIKISVLVMLGVLIVSFAIFDINSVAQDATSGVWVTQGPLSLVALIQFVLLILMNVVYTLLIYLRATPDVKLYGLVAFLSMIIFSTAPVLTIIGFHKIIPLVSFVPLALGLFIFTIAFVTKPELADVLKEF
jgi:hypothetical protein